MPTRAVQDGGDGRLEPFVRVTGHQPGPTESTSHETAQEAQPERAILARSDIQPQDLTLSTRVDADGDDDCHRDDPAILADLKEGRVQPDIRIRPGQRPRAKALDDGVEVLTQPADLALADAVDPERLDQVVHPAG